LTGTRHHTEDYAMAWLLGVGVAAAVAKLFEGWIPRAAYRVLLAAGITLPLVATGYAGWMLWNGSVGWLEVALLVGMYVLTGLGTTLGYHRLATHRSFETGQVVRGVFLALGAMALQGKVVNWSAWHLKHHAASDQEGDPHSPLEGFFHAHVGWILKATPAERERYCKRLLADPVVMFVDRTNVLWVTLGLAIPFAVAGWAGLIWGGLVRIAVGNHLTFAVNSVCHKFGKQPFDTGDESRNNWLMGAIGLGEGWHNNHHAFPSMAYHGMTPSQPDLTALVIRLLQRLGLAWNVKVPAPAAVQRRRRPRTADAA
jgi:stearoyl-CoA desaturase (delta-9 desaturase)